jgi:signal transduction histidine kinase
MTLRRAATAIAGSERTARATAEDSRLRGRWLLAARAAWVSVAAVSLVLFIAGIPAQVTFAQTVCPTDACSSGQLGPAGMLALHAAGLTLGFYAAFVVALNVAFTTVFAVLGALIFWRRSDDRMALLASIALLTFGVSAFTGALDPLALEHPSWRLLVAAVNFLGSACFILFLYVFPDARFVPRAMRWVTLAVLAQQLLHYFFAFSPLDSRAWPLPHQFIVPVALLGTIVFAQVYRYRRVSSTAQREQTKWVVFGITAGLGGYLTVLTALNIVLQAVGGTPGGMIIALAGVVLMDGAVLLIPVSIGIAILRSHLFDVDQLINRTLVYGALPVCIIAVYVLIVGSLGVLFQARGDLVISLLATGLVAVLFQPLRERLQRGVNRLMYGHRDEPYVVISRLSQRLDATLTPEAMLPAITETVAQALKLPYAAITLKEAGQVDIAASFGMPVDEPLEIPLVYQAETIGALILGPRAPGEPWVTADRDLLDELAHHAGAAAHAVRLTGDLQRSNTELVTARERLVTAREEERRRLRRDLHDGLGPALAALTLKVGAARKLLPRDQAAVDILLEELSDDIQATVADIRRLVYNLRPPTLDELGLIGAIRERAAEYTTGIGTESGSGLRIVVDAPDRLPYLPAAVEVAAYRITQEALTNVAHHAQARICHVRLRLDDTLQLEITDDGIGLVSERRAGVGLSAMRERAVELGGACAIERLTAGGTRVLAHLPVPKES